MHRVAWVRFIRNAAAVTAAVAGAVLPGCVSAYKQSVGSDSVRTFQRIFLTDFNIAWESVLVALKSSRLDVSNREGGVVLTKWTDNTAERNFTDSFGSADSYLKAQYRFRVTVAKGFYNGKPSVKVSVQKDQLVQRDVLEGWRSVESDEVDENTLLYRIGRTIHLKTELAKIEEERIKKELENVEF
ncbi:MAG: hypothetical protein A2X94_07585 [Bdellovibrionales bacterium GWB1_55_8]|nr:MAG: hypothetical protein A2X94_07585 [Bdellovibrionales bacterium GWB1_55_8]